MSTDVHTTSRTFHFPDTANRTTECHSFAKKKKTPNKYVSVSFEQVKIMTMHNKSSVNTERISSKSKFVQGHRVTPKNLSKYSIHRSAYRSINAVKNP